MKRLSAAEGYLDLELPERALGELAAIRDPGPWEATVEYLKGEALIAARRFDEAIAPLKRAAQLIPAPHSRDVWRSLSECYRNRGDDEMADLTDIFASASPETPPALVQVLQMTLLLEQLVEDADPDWPDDLWNDEDLDASEDPID
jgi:Flp pilus assembly protein TadD